jgi:hypothetical protein
MIPPKSQRPLVEATPSLWVKLADIHPTNALFEKDKLPDGFTFPPVTLAPVLNMLRPSAKTKNPLQ